MFGFLHTSDLGVGPSSIFVCFWHALIIIFGKVRIPFPG